MHAVATDRAEQCGDDALRGKWLLEIRGAGGAEGSNGEHQEIEGAAQQLGDDQHQRGDGPGKRGINLACGRALRNQPLQSPGCWPTSSSRCMNGRARCRRSASAMRDSRPRSVIKPRAPCTSIAWRAAGGRWAARSASPTVPSGLVTACMNPCGARCTTARSFAQTITGRVFRSKTSSTRASSPRSASACAPRLQRSASSIASSGWHTRSRSCNAPTRTGRSRSPTARRIMACMDASSLEHRCPSRRSWRALEHPAHRDRPSRP